jgi:hypothetical protein
VVLLANVFTLDALRNASFDPLACLSGVSLFLSTLVINPTPFFNATAFLVDGIDGSATGIGNTPSPNPSAIGVVGIICTRTLSRLSVLAFLPVRKLKFPPWSQSKSSSLA